MIAVYIIRNIFNDHRLHPIYETPLICALSLSISYIVVWIFSKIPLSKYTVGLK